MKATSSIANGTDENKATRIACFSFNETKHLNRYIDYGYFYETKKRIQKLFIEKNNPLKLFKNHHNRGIVTIEDNTSSVYKVSVRVTLMATNPN